MGCETPSPGSKCPAGDVIRAGTGRWAGPDFARAPRFADPSKSGIDALAGVPPTGGGWWEYHTFSARFTTELPPCSRNHSAPRAPTELPRLGFVSALPSDTQTGVSATTTAHRPDNSGCRPAIARRAEHIARPRHPRFDPPTHNGSLPPRPFRTAQPGWLG